MQFQSPPHPPHPPKVTHFLCVIRQTSITDSVLASNFMSGALCVTMSPFYHQILCGAERTATMESSRLTFLLCSRLQSTTQYMTIYQGLTCQSPPSVPATPQRWITPGQRKDLLLFNGSWIVLQDN